MSKKVNEQKINVIENNQETALTFIMDEYFKAGFGALNKSDIDLIFFTVLEFYGNNSPKSDYSYSKLLGITQQRVRNFKEKSYLKFGTLKKNQYDEEQIWKTLEANIHNASYDQKSGKITIPIYDINLFRELEHLLEKHLHSTVNTHLNPKIFQISLHDFFKITLLCSLNNNDSNIKNNKKISINLVKLLKEKVKGDEQLEEKINEENDLINIGKQLLITGGQNVLISVLKDAVPGGNTIFSVLQKVGELVSKKGGVL